VTPPLQHAPYLEVTWTDEVTGRQGYLVIDRLIRGVSSGGLRMRAGCTLEEVRRLAAGMTLKEALNYDPRSRYIPLGGAKGGIDIEPRDPTARGVLTRYLGAVRPYLEQFWTAGEDLGLSQSLLDDVMHELGLQSSVQAVYPLLTDQEEGIGRLREAFAASSDGVSLDALVGGYGVATAAIATLDIYGVDVDGTRAFVQGFGSMGGGTARYLARAGLTVVGVSDVRGVVANPNGLDIEALLGSRDSFGSLDRSRLRPDDRELPAEEWLSVPAELLVPAATSDCIDAGNHHRIGARFIVEAANMPVSAEAEAALAGRGVVVIPDVVANSATNSWWWWTLFGDIGPTVTESFAKIEGSMRALVVEVLSRAAFDDSTPRAAALAIAGQRLHEIGCRFGNQR
jgi:glutamate dehydrogenase (NAD(P)+)